MIFCLLLQLFVYILCSFLVISPFSPRNMSMRFNRSALVAAMSLMFIQTSTQAMVFKDVVVFGDSLSDGGNVGLATLQKENRFMTNPGKTTPELVAQNFGIDLSPSLKGGHNYAWGGATVTEIGTVTPSLGTQVQSYLQANNQQANPETLYQVWGGANDIFQLTQAAQEGKIAPTQVVVGTQQAAQKEVELLKNLQDAGANYAVVYNIPNIGVTPRALSQGQASAQKAQALTEVFNMTLDAGLNELSEQGMNIVPVNIFSTLNEIVGNPEQYGFTDVTTPICGTGSSITCEKEGTGYLFADGIHPTAQMHALLAQVVVQQFNAPQQLAMLSEAPRLITNAQYRAVRNEMLNDMQGGETRPYMNLDYSHQKLDAKGTAPSLTANNINLTFGFDAKVNDVLSAGLGLSLSDQKGKWGNATGEYNLRDISAIAHTVYHQDDMYVGAFLNAGSLKYNKVERRINMGPNQRTEKGSTQGSHFGGGIDLGTWFNLGQVKTGPFARAEWQTIQLNKYTEKSQDSTAMFIAKQQRDSLVSGLGWRLQGDVKIKDLTLSPVVEAAWNHEFQDRGQTVTAGSTTMGGQFKVQTVDAEKDWGSVNVGFNAQLQSNLSSWMTVNTIFAHETKQDWGMNIGMKYMF